MQIKLSFKHQSGFTFLELVLVIIAISILLFFSLDRLWSIRKAAEQASVAQIIGNIKSTLGLEVVRLALKREMSAISELENKNPITLLAQVPTNYLGEKETTITTKGIWYFNKNTHTLIYNIEYQNSFSTTLKGQPRIRYKIKLIYNDNNHNQRFDIEHDNIYGLDLLPVEKYSWKTKDHSN